MSERAELLFSFQFHSPFLIRPYMYGQLQPVGGGDPIPLLKKTLKIGRRESCDVVLRFANVSAHHCQMSIKAGYWYVRDLNSRNGTKVNGNRVAERRVDSGDIISSAKQKNEVLYEPAELGAVGPPPPDDSQELVMDKPLLDKAGLSKAFTGGRDPAKRRRYGSSPATQPDDAADKPRDPNEPI